MKTELVLLALLMTLSAAAQAAATGRADSTILRSPSWEMSQAHWDRVLEQPRLVPELHLGKTDVLIGGPLIEGFRQKRLSADSSPGKRFLALPIVSLFVPRKMASPASENSGNYFAWGDSNRSWTQIAGGTPAGSGFSPAYNEPQNSLISLRIGGR
jgi:hypothetical protein